MRGPESSTCFSSPESVSISGSTTVGITATMMTTRLDSTTPQLTPALRRLYRPEFGAGGRYSAKCVCVSIWWRPRECRPPGDHIALRQQKLAGISPCPDDALREECGSEFSQFRLLLPGRGVGRAAPESLSGKLRANR
jgi:hypothetical protein